MRILVPTLLAFALLLGTVTACANPLSNGLLAMHFDAVGGALHGFAPGSGLLDLGPISAARQRHPRHAAQQHHRIGLRLEGDSGSFAHARVSVALSDAFADYTVRVDGVTLTAFPQLIDAAHPVGMRVVHDIEISVPRTAPPGPIANGIVWFAETD